LLQLTYTCLPEGFEPSDVPEPANLALTAAGLFGLFIFRRRPR
jgi:hypothetical protein